MLRSGNPNMSTEEGGSELGYQLLERVFLDAVAFGLSAAVQSFQVAGGVDLMPISA